MVQIERLVDVGVRAEPEGFTCQARICIPGDHGLFELFSALRIHPVQYLLVGSARCLFYLLLLSLSEHVGFARAYTIASAAVVALIAGYVWAAFGNARAAPIAVMLIVL